MPLVVGSYGEWMGQGSGHQGDLLKSMRRSFAAAHAQPPAILFIDEIDSFPNRATVSHHYAEWEIQVVNALLAEIDGAQNREGVILIGACNHAEKLDPALTRSGRLDRHFRIPLPSQSELERILREHLGDELPGASLAELALNAAGASGADVERFVREARRRCRHGGRDMVPQDLLAAVGGDDPRSPEERWFVAVHEAGHAVACTVLEPGLLRAVSVRPSASSGGSQTRGPGRNYMRLPDIQRDIVISLAGRAAEDVVFGEVSSASGGAAFSDLGRSTMMATLAVGALGLDAGSGLLWPGLPDAVQLPTTLVDNPAIAARVRTMLDEAYRKAVVLIVERRAAVEAVARALLARRVLDGNGVAAIVQTHPAGRPVEQAP